MPTKLHKLSILHTGDIHGNLDSLPYLATVVGKHRTKKPDTLLLDAGDWSRGHELSEQFQGKPVIEIFNEMGYTAVGVGEGDLAWGLGSLRARAREARFPVLAANLRDARGNPPEDLAPYALIDTCEVRIAIVGLCCADCALEGETQVLDPIAVLREVAAQVVAEGAQALLVLSHLGLEADRQLAAAVPGIACIVGGHSHDELNEPDVVEGTVISHAGAEADTVGALELELAVPTQSKPDTRPSSKRASPPRDAGP